MIQRRVKILKKIVDEIKTRGLTLRQAVVSKKAHLNQIRIYMRYRYPEKCRQMTMDMKWLDRTFLGPKSKTHVIC